ncbi:MAG: hypothetical protein ACLQPH_04145 [Acidimicrobiales bacterium]
MAAGFWLAGAIAAWAAGLTTHWSRGNFDDLMAIGGLCLIPAVVFFFAGARMPHWALHVGGVTSWHS